MSAASGIRPALALARREFVRFFRQRSRVVGALLPPVLAWLLLGFGFGTTFRLPGAPGAGGAAGTAAAGAAAAGGGYLAYFLPGTIALVVLFAAIFSTISVIEDRAEGFLQGVLVSPVSPLSIVLGKVLGGTALALLQGALLLPVAPLVGAPADPVRLLAAFGILALLALALTGLGFAIAWSLSSTQGFHAVMNLFLIPMWLLSGSFFPAAGAPPWLRAAIAVNPMTYGVAALRRALDPAQAVGLPSTSLSALVTFLFAAATLTACALLVARNPSGPGPGRNRAGSGRR